MVKRTVRWIHVSDWHVRATPDRDCLDVLNALIADVTDLVAHGLGSSGPLKPDFVVHTGDIAFSGKAEEYSAAIPFLKKLMDAAKLNHDRLFLVPGNHDVDDATAFSADSLLSVRDEMSYTEACREWYLSVYRIKQLLNRFVHYRAAFSTFTPHCVDPAKPFYTNRFLTENGVSIGIAGLNSAIGSRKDDQEAGREMVLGRWQVDDAAKQLDSQGTSDLRIAVFHHPLDNLNEYDASQSQVALLRAPFDIVLRGHLHRAAGVLSVRPDGTLATIAAGSSYEKRWTANGYLMVEADLSAQSLTLWFRRWAPEQSAFVADTAAYLGIGPDGKCSLPLKPREVVPLSSREEYIAKQVRIAESASPQDHILLFMNKLHRTNPFNSDAVRVNEALVAAARRGVIIRILVGATEERLPGAIELARNPSIEVRFDRTLFFADVNYFCAGESRLILAVRDLLSDPDEYRRSQEWYEITSSTLVSAMSRTFDQHWNAPGTLTLEEMMRGYIPDNVDINGRKSIAERLGLSVTEVTEYANRRPLIVLLIGRPGSGKTTLAKSIVSYLNEASVLATSLSDLDFFQAVFEDRTKGGGRYERTSDGGYYILDRSLYDEGTVDLAKRVLAAPKNARLIVAEMARQKYTDALRIMKNHSVVPDVVVYVDVEYETAVRRNSWRKSIDNGHYVSAKEMEETYRKDDAVEVEAEYGKAFVRLPNPDTRNDWQRLLAASMLSVVRSRISNR